MAKIKPHLDALNVKHKGDKQGLQQAQLALYKEHGVNPAAGCFAASYSNADTHCPLQCVLSGIKQRKS